MVLSISKAAKAGYYYQPTGLESHWSRADGHWLSGDNLLGVGPDAWVDDIAPKGTVGIHDLQDLLERRAAKTGESPVFGEKSGQSGHDFVFSAPKSVSILWAFSNTEQREKLELAQHRAVRAAVDVLARHAIKERVGKGGRELRTAKAAIAAFTHCRSRPATHALVKDKETDINLTFADPNLHTHLVVPDLVAALPRIAEGSGMEKVSRLKIAYTALYGRWSMALGSWYHAHLAMELTALGFALEPRLEPSGANGLFQIRGIEPGWIDAFSARTAGRVVVPPTVLASRLSRNKLAHKGLEAETIQKSWDDYADYRGIDRSALLKDVRQTPDEKAARPVEDIEKLIETALQSVSETEAVLQEQDLYRGIASAMVSLGYYGLCNSDLIERVKGDDRLVALLPTESYQLSQWTTRSNQREERSVIRLAEGMLASGLNDGAIQPVYHSEDPVWTSGQKLAIDAVCGTSAIAVITGPPGVGKTASLGPAIAAFQARHGDKSVVGAAESWQSALNLRKTFGIESYALAALIAKERRKPRKLEERKLLIVDEAGLLSTKRMLHVLRLANAAGIKLVLLGDIEQLNPIGAGSGLRLLGEALMPVELTEVVRQDNPGQKKLVEHLIAVARAGRAGQNSVFEHDGSGQDAAHEGMPEVSPVTMVSARSASTRSVAPTLLDPLAKALVASRSWRSHGDSDAAVKDVVETLLQKGADGQPLEKVALARSHVEAHHITHVMRKALRAQKLLDDKEIVVPAITPMGQKFRLRLAKGDRIRFQMREDGIGVINGTTAKIEDIKTSDTSTRLTVVISGFPGKTDVGSTVSFNLSAFEGKDGRVRMAAAYAMTIYGAQGLTVDEAVILRSNKISFRELYVAATRARRSFTIIDVKPSRAGLEQGPYADQRFAANLFCELRAARSRDRHKALARDYINPRNARVEPSQGWMWDMMTEDTVTTPGSIHAVSRLDRKKRAKRAVAIAIG